MMSIFLISLHVCTWLPYLLFVLSIKGFGGVGSQECQTVSYRRRYAGIAPACTRARPIDYLKSKADPKQRSMLATAHHRLF